MSKFASLIVAVWENNMHKINALIAAGADVNAQNEDGYSPLHYACARGHVLPVQLLLEAGADPSLKNKFGNRPCDMTSVDEIKNLVVNFGLGGGRATKAAIS